MLRRLNKLIKGGKRVKLIGGPGNGMMLIIDGKAKALEYEVDNIKSYYQWDGLTDGTYELYSYLGKQDTPININDNNSLSYPQSIVSPGCFSDTSTIAIPGFDPSCPANMKYKMNFKQGGKYV